MAKKKRPTDVNKLAKSVVDNATSETESEELSAAARAGSLGGKKGGPARAAKLSEEERSRIAKKAAAARWNREG